MDIGQAVRRLKSGEKVRRPEWPEGHFLDPESAEDYEIKLTYADLVANDWEPYDE